MTFESPFHAATEDHEGDGHLCLSRVVLGGDADERTWVEFWNAFFMLARPYGVDESSGRLEVGGQVLFYMGRHLIELTLKRCCSPARAGHDLKKLLSQVPPSHSLRGSDAEARELQAFVNEVASLDPGGDQGRYGRTRDGIGALADTCCMDPLIFSNLVYRLGVKAGLLSSGP